MLANFFLRNRDTMNTRRHSEKHFKEGFVFRKAILKFYTEKKYKIMKNFRGVF